MTAICGGGTSSAKPGFSASLFMGPSAIAALLNNIPTLWAVPLAAYIGYVTYQLSEFCPNDPPSVPTITAFDVLNLLNPANPVLNADAGAKFQQLIGAYVWYQVCQCDSVSTPAPPSPPAEPTDMPQINPPISPPIQEHGCADITRTLRPSDTQAIGGGPPSGAYGMIQQFLTSPGPTVTRVSGHPQTAYLVPAGTTAVEFFLHVESGGGDGTTVQGELLPYNATGTNVAGAFSYVVPSSGGDFHTGPVALGSGVAAVILNHTGSATVNSTLTIELRFFCGSTQPTIQQDCCPPDPILAAQVQSILQLVTLIQRQSVPFAYIASTVHSGLTGSGEITVEGLIGARVLVTSEPFGESEQAGHPDAIAGVGWLNWGNADGWLRREFIGASPIVSLPTSAGQFTRIGYSLEPGAEVTITELVREP